MLPWIGRGLKVLGVVGGLVYNLKSAVLTFSMRLGISLGNPHPIGWRFFGARPWLNRSP